VSICFNKTPLQFDHPFITCHQFWRHFRTPLVIKRHQTLDPSGVFRFLDFLDPLAGYETRFLTPPQGGSDKFSRPPWGGSKNFFSRYARFFLGPPLFIFRPPQFSIPGKYPDCTGAEDIVGPLQPSDCRRPPRTSPPMEQRTKDRIITCSKAVQRISSTIGI